MKTPCDGMRIWRYFSDAAAEPEKAGENSDAPDPCMGSLCDRRTAASAGQAMVMRLKTSPVRGWKSILISKFRFQIAQESASQSPLAKVLLGAHRIQDFVIEDDFDPLSCGNVEINLDKQLRFPYIILRKVTGGCESG